MRELANRLMLRNQRSSTSVATAVFGTAGTLGRAIYDGQAPVRIGLWPVICNESPEIGMGIFTVLGHLFDRFAGVRTYRLAAWVVEDEIETYDWTIEKSQFGVDDWQLENLDDNVGIWGTLEKAASGDWVLKLWMENDIVESDEDITQFTCEAATLSDLVFRIVNITKEMVQTVIKTPKQIKPTYSPQDTPINHLESILKVAFNAELEIYLSLLSQNNHLIENLSILTKEAKDSNQFSAWLTSNSISHYMTYNREEVESLLPLINQVIQQYNPDQIAPITLSIALHNSQLTDEAYNILNHELESKQGSATTYLTLSELYQRSGRITDAVDILQDAIEEEITSSDLYEQYARLLIAIEYSNLEYNTVILIDPTHSSNYLIDEAIAAYDAALAFKPGDPQILSQQVLQLIETTNLSRLVPTFKQLALNDDTGDYVRSITDALYSLEDVSSLIDIMESIKADNPQRIDVHINLAIVYTIDENSDAALEALNNARKLTDDEETIADIAHLTLIAEDPEFEMYLSEINDRLDAGNVISAEDVEFLEETITRAPAFSEAYILLAKAYNGWEETGSALETLLDGHKHIPEDPNIIVLLSEQLWDLGERETALSYLYQGLSRSPTHVPLLARAGQFLFEDGQEDAARAYLSRAETISPRDPVLAEVRVHIARQRGQ